MAISQAISQRVARCVEIKFLSMLNKREQKTVNSDSCLNNYIELKQTIHNWWSHRGLSLYSASAIFHERTFLFEIRNQPTFPQSFTCLNNDVYGSVGDVMMVPWRWGQAQGVGGKVIALVTFSMLRIEHQQLKLWASKLWPT